MNATNRKSAAGIVIRKKVGPTSTDPISVARDLIANCGTSKNDQAIAAITACIGEGIDTRGQIMEVLIRLGFDRGHAAIMLKMGTGTVFLRRHWTRDGEGRYSLLS